MQYKDHVSTLKARGREKMAKQLQKMFGGGAPRGVGTGLKLLGAAALVGIGISQSMYTGKTRVVVKWHDVI